MSTAAARKRLFAVAASNGPATTVQATNPTEILAVMRDWKKCPSPVRPMGSGSSTTRCVTANGGTQLDLSPMNRVLKIDGDTVTVQPGISLIELAQVLGEEGLELIGGFELAGRTVGGAVCAAGLEASMAGDVGQFSSHVVQMKVLSPNGKKFVVNDKTKSLLALMRLSYGLLGVVYEVTLRVRPVQGFSVQTAKVTFKDFGKLGAKLPTATAGVKLYLLPFRDRIYFELRRPAAEGDPGRKFAWKFKDWAVNSALPGAAASLAKAVPIRGLRYPLIDSLSEVAQSLVNNVLVRSGSNSVEQSGRYRMLGSAKTRFTYTTWAFPASEFANTVLGYKLFCKEHYARTGFRCELPAVSYRLNRDRSALLSPSFDSPLFTISPLSTQTEGWDDFVLDLADFAANHHGVPFFNQTKNAPPELVAQRYGSRLAFFNKVRRELDPQDRLLNQYFGTYFPTAPTAA
ncbi:MAG TPA: FAD-dependent oxidoreductase [Gammaproteobacteria bacterium]|nr:FAD-dependent oxidoreductase [Gammaproteobacteria bacterium]